MKMTTRSLIGSGAIGGIATKFVRISKRSYVLMGLTIAAAMSFPSIASAATTTLLSDNFDTENSGNGTLAYTGFTNWDVTSQDVDLIGTGFYDLYPGNGLYVDLTGTNPGTLTSKASYAFDAGDTVNLSFNLGGAKFNYGQSVNVSLGTLFNQSFTPLANTPFATFSQSFTVLSATNAQLIFAESGGTFDGLMLDNVVLTKSSQVPEPSDVLGTAIAFGSIVMLKRKLTKKTLG